MQLSDRQLEKLTQDCEQASELPEAIFGWVQQIGGDPLEPTATEMALGACISNAADLDELDDQLMNTIYELKLARERLEEF
tara:strand:+ start:1087 stop:1329 length:243 start_codon:yes stop_codon:yes gene_type:complete